ncbi:pentapeptide repeat-containing protein [Streptomyces sp. enrichment culture]|uniref:pentapeptide repeat-containing protein n=1 Tax=Streptomyces sp. enrichment culture TaxID=1795815 RepID=UPI003F551EF8
MAVTGRRQPGEDNLEVRLGGTYALERIMDDSPRDQPTIINLRATFVRTHAAEPPEPGTDTDETFTEVPADVVAAVKSPLSWTPRAMTPLGFSTCREPTDLTGIDLTDAALRDANLTGAYLEDADLADAQVSVEQLLTAYVTPLTVLPARLADNSAIQEHIASDG